MAAEFKTSHRRPDGPVYVSSWCQSCHTKYSNRSRTARNEESQAHAKRTREPWMASEIERLIEMTKAGVPAKAIGMQLGRTTSAIYTARHTLKEFLK